MKKVCGDLVPGEASGESEGKDSSVLAEVGVTSDGFRDPALRVPGFLELVESWELVRSRLLFSLLLLRPAIFNLGSIALKSCRYTVGSCVGMLRYRDLIYAICLP